MVPPMSRVPSAPTTTTSLFIEYSGTLWEIGSLKRFKSEKGHGWCFVFKRQCYGEEGNEINKFTKHLKPINNIVSHLDDSQQRGLTGGDFADERAEGNEHGGSGEGTLEKRKKEKKKKEKRKKEMKKKEEKKKENKKKEMRKKEEDEEVGDEEEGAGERVRKEVRNDI